MLAYLLYQYQPRLDLAKVDLASYSSILLCLPVILPAKLSWFLASYASLLPCQFDSLGKPITY